MRSGVAVSAIIDALLLLLFFLLLAFFWLPVKFKPFGVFAALLSRRAEESALGTALRAGVRIDNDGGASDIALDTPSRVIGSSLF